MFDLERRDEATDDNVSGDSGVTSSAGEPQPAPHHPATSSDGAQSEVVKKAGKDPPSGFV